MERASATLVQVDSHGSAAPSAQKIIVGLDFGTTFSGMCWVTSNGQANDIEVKKSWPGRAESVSKVPSRIAYASENPTLNANLFGFQIRPSHKQVAWFKLRLDDEAAPTEYDDPNLRHFTDPGQDHLPARLTAKIVTKDFLKELHALLMIDLRTSIAPKLLSKTSIEVWLTVPASWSDPAKMKTREAAIEAGFGKHEKDSVKVISEPEAAGIFALCPEVNQNAELVAAGETFIVCDCGGGTVDLTVYTLKSAPPNPEFLEICKGKAGKCGATMIDRAFCYWMERTFGEAYTKLPQAQRGPGSHFMREFEDCKTTFSSRNIPNFKHEYFEISPIKMDVPRSSKYDRESESVNLSLKTLKRFFDQVISHVIQLLEEQIEEARMALGGKHVDRVILVGGLGNNLYLRDRLTEWCRQQTPVLGLISPPYGESQSCIMKGAAIRGLLGLKPTYRVSRRHYGFGVSLHFREGIDSPEDAWLDDDGEKMCFGRIVWLVRKGQFVENDFHMEVKVRKYFTHSTRRRDVVELWSCDGDHAPDYESDDSLFKVASISYDFYKSDFKGIKRTYSNTLKRNCQILNYFVRANMGADEGVLTVEVAGARLFGSANITFHEMD
ncbi:hsp70-like protein [Phyllosticta citribraziliensis]|uniref:Hsp70-like protein n=1 Tax=Phyllosticta citribraziliensis TaxID=989973 RepID=A0ABR1LZ16_9PEZI